MFSVTGINPISHMLITHDVCENCSKVKNPKIRLLRLLFSVSNSLLGCTHLLLSSRSLTVNYKVDVHTGWFTGKWSNFSISRIMVRSSYHLIFGLLSSNHHHGSLSSREDVIQFLSQQADIKTTMKLITAPSAPAELLKMDSVSFCFWINY